MYRPIWTGKAKADYDHWLRRNSAVAQRIDELIIAMQKDPRRGDGRPEPMKHDLAGYWNRRINRRHRLSDVGG